CLVNGAGGVAGVKGGEVQAPLTINTVVQECDILPRDRPGIRQDQDKVAPLAIALGGDGSLHLTVCLLGCSNLPPKGVWYPIQFAGWDFFGKGDRPNNSHRKPQ
ncbi:MAG TPA: hypothetical protein V6D02_06885, partial [Candidatus Obscuribacterales bacterium]